MSPTVPRLQHVLPRGQVTQAPVPLAVVARITWHDGHETTEDAIALAWTRGEVLVEWTTPWGNPHRVWVQAEHVSRTTSPAERTTSPAERTTSPAERTTSPGSGQGSRSPDARA